MQPAIIQSLGINIASFDGFTYEQNQVSAGTLSIRLATLVGVACTEGDNLAGVRLEPMAQDAAHIISLPNKWSEIEGLSLVVTTR